MLSPRRSPVGPHIQIPAFAQRRGRASMDTSCRSLYDHGLHVKTTGNSVVVAPPFTITEAEIEMLVEIMREVLQGA